jgi:hypothetical protein
VVMGVQWYRSQTGDELTNLDRFATIEKRDDEPYDDEPSFTIVGYLPQGQGLITLFVSASGTERDEEWSRLINRLAP